MTIRNRKPLIALIVAAGSVLAIPAMAQSAQQSAAQAASAGSASGYLTDCSCTSSTASTRSGICTPVNSLISCHC